LQDEISHKERLLAQIKRVFKEEFGDDTSQQLEEPSQPSGEPS